MQVWRINFLSYSDKKNNFRMLFIFTRTDFICLTYFQTMKNNEISLSLSLLEDLERDTENSFWLLVVSSCSMLRFASTWAQ